MRTHPFVSALEPRWRGRLDALARARGWPTAENVARLADDVAELAERYNAGLGAGIWTPGRQAARLGFFFARDVPKAAGAVRELVEAGLLPDRPLRVLDLGAGLGATSHGLARAARAGGFSHPIAVTAVDRDFEGLGLATALSAGTPGLTIANAPGDVHARAVGGPWDLVLLGQLLCELDAGAPDRVELHAAWLRSLLDEVAADGAVVVVEPALREPTRHLQRVRDALAERVYAPCLHRVACPMLARESDWCHEALAVDLPDWLVPVAEVAGLRASGLTFSYLVLRRDGRQRSGALRVVSSPLPSKGRLDRFLCGTFADGPGRRKIGRLDRHASDANALWDEIDRGDVLAPIPDRLGPDTVLSLVSPKPA